MEPTRVSSDFNLNTKLLAASEYHYTTYMAASEGCVWHTAPSRGAKSTRPRQFLYSWREGQVKLANTFGLGTKIYPSQY